MKGIHEVIVESKRIHYKFSLRRNLTIIRGDSATGKTTLVDMIQQYIDNPSGSAVSIRCDKNCYVLSGSLWKNTLSGIRDSIVFIDEGNEFVGTNDFADAISRTDNYYVIVTRESLPSLPYSVEEIYGIREAGKYGRLKQTYNELFRIYGTEYYNEKTQDAFEWLILRSNLFQNKNLNQMLEHPSDYIESGKYFSWERFFTRCLVDISKETYLQYNKRHLNANYLSESVEKKILAVIPDSIKR